MYQSQNFAAGVALEFQDAADFLRILEAPAADLTVIFYRSGAEVARAEKVGEGYAEKFTQQFDKLRITSTAGGVVEFVTRLGAQVSYDKAPTGATTIVGSVAVSGIANPVNVAGITNTVTVQVEPDAFTQAQKTVTNASTSMLAAKADRRYLFVQNNHATGIVYITLDGTAATVAKGIRLLPGESYECRAPAPSGQIFAIGDIATQSNVIAVEG